MNVSPFPNPTRRLVHAALRRLGLSQRETDLDLAEDPLTDESLDELEALEDGEHLNRVTPFYLLMLEARTEAMDVALSRYEPVHPDASPPDLSPSRSVEGWATTLLDAELLRDLTRLAWATHREEHKALSVYTAAGTYPFVLESRHAYLYLAPRVEGPTTDAPAWRSEP